MFDHFKRLLRLSAWSGAFTFSCVTSFLVPMCRVLVQRYMYCNSVEDEVGDFLF